MRLRFLKWAICLILLVTRASASVLYVSLDSANPTPPYSDWSTAATNIQDAVDASSDADMVLVTNGLYATGWRRGSADSPTTNRVLIGKAITLQSVNGPEFTTIQGRRPVVGAINDIMRCVYLTNGASLIGFTLTNGSASDYGGGVYSGLNGQNIISNCVITGNSSSGEGGGVGGLAQTLVTHCMIVGNRADGSSGSPSGGGAVFVKLDHCLITNNFAYLGGGIDSCDVTNCILVSNFARFQGGGAQQGVLANCFFSGNVCTNYGGAAYGSTLYNCTVVGNSAQYQGGGLYQASAYNCIIHNNTAPTGPEYLGGSEIYCCLSPLTGTNNIDVDPRLASLSHLSSDSPCRNIGSSTYAYGTDIDGEAWASPPSIGCDEYHVGMVDGSLDVSFYAASNSTYVTIPTKLIGNISGKVSQSVWDCGDGNLVTNKPIVIHPWLAAGDYAVVLRAYNDSNPDGVAITNIMHVMALPVYYVATNSFFSSSPYTNWNMAARNIQDAILAASRPALILVSNGVYQSGSAFVNFTTYRVGFSNSPFVIQSVNGPSSTSIDGGGSSRCAYLTVGSSLSGFTITNGNGGGIWCESTNVTVTNCIFRGNRNAPNGGGAYGGTLMGCTFLGNSATFGGGACGCVLQNCLLITNSSTSSGGGGCSNLMYNCTIGGNLSSFRGGGVAYSVLENCILTNNFAAQNGGGSANSTITNCIFYKNSATNGGGSYQDVLLNCSLIGNKAFLLGGGANSSALNNCIISSNICIYVNGTGGGGGYECEMTNCLISSNTGLRGGGAYISDLMNCVLTNNLALNGGAAYSSVLINCVLSGNYATNSAGGARLGTLINCTVIGNSAGTNGGGTDLSVVTNSIIFFNNCPSNANMSAGQAFYTCTTPLPTNGFANITNDPMFLNLAAGDFHLQTTSLCINSGNNSRVRTVLDLDGNARIAGGTVDMGAYEFQTPASMLSYA